MDTKVKAILARHSGTKSLISEKARIEPGWDWSGVDLSGWQLTGLIFSSLEQPANFRKANLKHSNLSKSILVGANLESANLQNATLNKAYLREANLKGARMERANLEKANLIGANLQGVRIRDSNMQKVRLEDADLQGANMRHADLRWSNLKRAKLTKADLKDANLREAYLKNADMGGAYLKRTNFEYAFLGGVNFQNAILNQGNLKYSEFNEKSNLRGVDLYNCKLDYSTLKNAHNKLDKVIIQERKNKYSEAMDVYLDLKNYFRTEGRYDISGEYFYREKIMERKLYYNSNKFSDKVKWFISLLYSALCGYGEKPYRVILSSLVIIFIFGTIFWASNGITTNMDYNIKWYDNYYFSVVTFTTLGFGDIHPCSHFFFKLCTMIEAFMGAFMIALFVLTFGRRLIR